MALLQEAYRAKFYNAETAVKPLEWLDVSEPFVVTQERERSQSSMESFRDRSASHGHDDRESVVNAEMNQMKKPDMWDDLRDLVVRMSCCSMSLESVDGREIQSHQRRTSSC